MTQPSTTEFSANIYALVADIGGTNTRVALVRDGQLVGQSIRRYRNAEFAELEAVLSGYLQEMGNVDCLAACVAVAGPVRDNIARMTNLDWTIDCATLAHATRAESVYLLNDLQAQGHALRHMPAERLPDILSPQHANPVPEGATQLVIGIGTGFNIAGVYNTAQCPLVTPSESGHANFPAFTPDDIAICDFVAARHGYPGLDDIISGRGLENIYAWLCGSTPASRDGAPLPTAAEIMLALEHATDPYATEAVQHFVRMLAHVSGNMALTYLPFGGIFLAGGVARAISPWLTRFDFQQHFESKGRFSVFMKNFRVSLIADDYAALAGCASFLGSKRVDQAI